MKLPDVYVINLDSDTARLEAISHNLATLGLAFKRIPGVVGKEIPNWENYVDLKIYAKRNRRESPRPGEVGCFLSHLKAIETFLQTNEPWCIILEDDAEVLPECLDVIKNLEAKDDWDLVKLFNFHAGMPVKKRALGIKHHLVINLMRTTSCAAYAINRSAARKLLRTALPITEQIDHAIDRPWETDLRIRGVRPMPVTLATGSQISTIGYESKSRRNSLRKQFALLYSRGKKEVQRFTYSIKECFTT
jgi:glycosyl transferase, family 25